MLGTFTVETFGRRLGERFRIHPQGAPPYDVTLIEATALARDAGRGGGDDGGRTPFSIVFRAPADRLLPQQIYRLDHDAIGTFEIFLVPIGPDREGMRYEAVFT